MCVIAYKPMNVDFMPTQTLEECFKNNPDGSGFMFCVNGKVHIRKGFMTFEDFNKELTRVRTKYGDKIPYVMHFRISTQAGVNPQCCHPYPVSSSMKDLKLLSCKADIGIAHNGIISLTSDKATDYNDTMKFITDYATLLIKDVKWYKNPNIAKALEKLCDSKLAIMGSDNHVELIGDFIKDNGCYYSNTTYKAPKYSFNTINSKYNPFNDYDTYNYYDDEWELFYNEKSEQYDLEPEYCPLSVDGLDVYCCMCSHRNKCKLLNDLLEDTTEEDYNYLNESYTKSSNG